MESAILVHEPVIGRPRVHCRSGREFRGAEAEGMREPDLFFGVEIDEEENKKSAAGNAEFPLQAPKSKCWSYRRMRNTWSHATPTHHNTSKLNNGTIGRHAGPSNRRNEMSTKSMIVEVKHHSGKAVTIGCWLNNKRSSGKIQFFAAARRLRLHPGGCGEERSK